MSRGATWIKADDGHYYEEPILRGDGWFICFDEDDPPELVVAISCKLSPKEILASIGLKGKIHDRDWITGRMFGGDYEFEDARSYWLGLKHRIPAKAITEYDAKSVGTGGLEEIPGVNWTAYDFIDNKRQW